MVKKELIERSPLRILEKTTHGNLKSGEIAVIASRRGVGKTACLVHIATDQLLQEKHVIHISFSANTGSIISWYEDIFKEISIKNKLDNAIEVHDEIIKNRVIMNFKQDGIHITEIEKSIENLIKKGNFSADTLVIDGYDFTHSSIDELKEFKKFAKDLGLSLWFSASVRDETSYFDGLSIPKLLEHLIGEISILISLRPKTEHIYFNLVKYYDEKNLKDFHLKLDPNSLLITEEELIC
ncbi:MAG: hypothetical protein PVI26_05185 [Chitinispirillia bacterium]|jgi:hypothetical protein